MCGIVSTFNFKTDTFLIADSYIAKMRDTMPFGARTGQAHGLGAQYYVAGKK